MADVTQQAQSKERTGDVKTLSGMQAAAYAAYALSDVATIFPITPASHMSEQVEKWSVEGRKNLMDQCVQVKEMQSEKGAAGALHGALSGGALASTFTASQGLMLMIPNMYKVSGELLPGVFHVTCRSLSAHALSIFGDHQDLMAVRATGCAMLGSSSVQECMDLSLVAHLSAIQGSIPFVHFFDGFRTSDEISTVRIISQDDMAKVTDWDAVKRFRDLAMDPLHPMVRGTAQSSDVYFQNREAPNRLYDALPAIVQANMDKVASLTGRQYHLFDYHGAPDADCVVVTMASSCDVVSETVDYLNAHGQKVGLVKVRLFRPFAPEALMATIPETARVICALDRTKEPGSQGEPLLQDVVMAVYDSGRTAPDGSPIKVIGGRYGLSSKDFTPTMASAVFANMAASKPMPRFTVGITDDLTHLSLPVAPYINTLPHKMNQSVFYGFGSDGTVGANKQAARLIADGAGKWVQEYSWFDSKKSGGLTISYLRLADQPIHSPYLIEDADYVACHKSIYVERGYPLTERLGEGGVFVLNSAWTLDDMERIFPDELKRGIASKHARFYNIDAAALAAKVGLGSRINMIMETVFLKLANVMPFDEAVAALKRDVAVMYASKGQDVVQKNIQAIDATLAELHQIDYPASWAELNEPNGDGAIGFPDLPPTPYDPQTPYVKDVLWPMERLEGNTLPTSAFDPAGFTPLGGTAHEKRRVAFQVPEWDPYKCIHCYQCSLVCPHAAIRPYLATDEELTGAPDAFETVPPFRKELAGLNFRIQNYPEDCVGCGSCAYNCPAPGKALTMKPIETQLPTQKENLAFAQTHITLKDDLLPATDVPGTQLKQPLLEFSSCCAGCGETPHVKMLTQLFGERLIIANATGCSSIWGGYAPAMPYCKSLHGRGPAWGNSLFEDNAEYGYGIMKAVKVRRAKLEQDVEEALKLGARGNEDVANALRAWKVVRDDGEKSLAAGEACVSAISPHASEHEVYQRLLDNKDMFQKKSVWAVGGDGWAFDIDYGGLDEVIASGENINILVLDTEGYSNTGGEMSKATQLGSVSTFSLDGKQTPKKRLARMAMQYDYVYVAQVCFGADMQQLIDVMREAEAYDGPSVVVALCPCISWGIKAGMGTAVGACKDAVRTGYWTLWHFNPDLAKAGKEPLAIDSASPEGEAALREFLMGQNRFASLAAREPALSDRLQQELAKERATNRQELESFRHV
ncbi:MAG: pyruvate:ferredoxin (flavodoxin) oxidoreductase [Eggerthellaceae bacterium]|nr:pyruvate:ferredoxin (flavodoxin) oxidoreductase [Eggerthellaceae bacterium]